MWFNSTTWALERKRTGSFCSDFERRIGNCIASMVDSSNGIARQGYQNENEKEMEEETNHGGRETERRGVGESACLSIPKMGSQRRRRPTALVLRSKVSRCRSLIDMSLDLREAGKQRSNMVAHLATRRITRDVIELPAVESNVEPPRLPSYNRQSCDAILQSTLMLLSNTRFGTLRDPSSRSYLSIR
jgi:hypothetical protein